VGRDLDSSSSRGRITLGHQNDDIVMFKLRKKNKKNLPPLACKISEKKHEDVRLPELGG
jgi:hypothetical protein